MPTTRTVILIRRAPKAFSAVIVDHSGGIMVTRVDAEIDEIVQRILLELENASSKDLSDAHYAKMILHLSDVNYTKRILQ